MPVIENPFAVLTAVVAPAILTNACSVLSLGTANRMARVVDRTRALNASLKTMDRNDTDRASHIEQLERLEFRAQLLIRSLRLFYFALGAFASSALVAILGSVLIAWDLPAGFHAAAALGFLIGIGAVGALATGCALMVRETKAAVEDMSRTSSLQRQMEG
jgi:hypothetical protein